MNKNMIIPGIINVVKEAFGLREVIGSIVGVSVIKVIGTGFCRGMFSNEAGMGSAPIFSATVDENDIELQARVASLSVVIDTLIICMITGITIISTGAYNTQDIQSVINKVFGMVPYGNIIVTVCLMIFVIATIPCWEYYGEQGIRYLFNSNISTYIMRMLYPLMIYVGCIMVQNIAWDLSSIANAAMTIPNMYMIYKLVN
jgi:AGCS family alanine or glycine:cation symporter